MAIDFNKKSIKDAVTGVKTALESNDSAKVEEAFDEFGKAVSADVYESVKQDMEAYQETQDESILAKRGVRTLTSKENAWYNKIIDVMRSANPKQEFIQIIGSDDEDDIMPNTIIEDVFRQLREEHPLLSKVDTESTGYLTKWIMNNHVPQTATWGAITDAIVTEITSDLKVADIKQNKLSCFVILEQGMEDLGPAFLDSYVREVMYEAMSLALEIGITSGTGKGMPAGMDRNITAGSYNDATGWEQKEAVEVTDFTPENYGKLLAYHAKDEKGKDRSFASVILICNQTDYLTKIMPATTVLNGMGAYVNNLFPFPTDVVISNAMDDGKAIIGIPDEYKVFIGKAPRNNVIEYSDDYRFLEDQRVFKVVQYADGIAYDNTSFQLLDISGLNPAYLNVKTISNGEETDTEKV